MDIDTQTLLEKYENAARMADEGDEQAARDARVMGDELRRRRDAQTQQGQPQQTSMGETLATGGEQLLAGVNEGLANVAGGPVDLVTAAINAPPRFSNLVNRGINATFGTDFRTDREQFIDPTTTVGGSEYFRRKGGDFGIIAPEEEGYETVRNVGEIGGTGLGILTTLGLGSTSGYSTGINLADDIANNATRELTTRPARTLTTEAAAATGAGVAGEYGGEIGYSVGGETGERIGQTLGELLGGLGAAIMTYGGGDVLRGLFAADDTLARSNAARRNNVPLSYGLIGNQNAQYLENVSGLNPFSRGSIERLQSGQVQATSEAADELATSLTGQNQPALTKYDAGLPAREAGQTALERLRVRLGTLSEQELDALGGPEAALHIDRIRDVIREVAPSLTNSQRNDLIKRYQDLEGTRITGYDATPDLSNLGVLQVPKGTPVDAALDAQIRNRLNNRVQRLQQLDGIKTPNRAQRREARNLRTRIKTDIAQINSNLGVRNDVLNSWRAELGQELPEVGRVGSGTQRTLYGATRDDQRIKAAQEGKVREFEEVTAEKQRLAGGNALEEGGDAAFLTKLTQRAAGNPKEAQEVWNYLTAPDAAGRIDAFQRNVSPEEFDRTMGDLLSLLGQPRSQAARGSAKNTDTFSPSSFMTNFDNLPQATKDKLFEATGGPQKIEDLRKLSQSLTSRGTASNPSGTTATAIIANIFGKGLQSPLVTLMTLGTNRVAASIMASPGVAEIIAKQYPQLDEYLKTVIAQRAGAAAIVDTSEAGKGLGEDSR